MSALLEILESRRSVGLLLITAAVWSAGFPGLSNGFLNYDDPDVIIENPRLESPKVTDVVGVFREVRDQAYLPFYYVALMPDAALGDGEPFAFHFGSLLWHTFNAILLFLLAEYLSRNRFLALAAALVFAVHPVACESVAWASGRKDQVSLAALLIGLLQWAQGIEKRHLGRLLLAGVIFLLGCFAKGSIVVFPLLAWLVAWHLRAGGRTGGSRYWLPHGLLALLALVPIVVHLKVAAVEGTVIVGAAQTVGEGLNLFLQALGAYGRHLLVPVRLSVHYMLDPQLPLGIDHVFGLVVLVLFLSGAFFMRRLRWVTLGLGLLWILASLLPFNNIFPRTSVAMADRYLAVGLPAFGMVIGALLSQLPRAASWISLAVLVVVLGGLCHLRTKDFHSGVSVFQAALDVDDGDPFSHMALAEALVLEKQNAADPSKVLGQAVAHQAKSFELAQRTHNEVLILQTQVRHAELLLRSGRATESTEQFAAALERARNNDEVVEALGLDLTSLRHNFASAFLLSGRRAEADIVLGQILAEDPKNPRARFTRLQLRLRDAAEDLQKLGPDDTAGHEEVRQRTKRSVEELELLAEGLRSSFKDGYPFSRSLGQDLLPRVLSELGNLYMTIPWMRGAQAKALPLANEIVEKAPDRGEGYALRAKVREWVGEDPAQVYHDLTLAIRNDPENVNYRLKAALLLQRIGKNKDARAWLLSAKALAPDSPIVQAELCDFYYRHAHHDYQGGKVEPALKLVAAALDEKGDHVPSLLLFGEMLQKRGEWEKSESHYRKALDLDPESKEAALGLARFHQLRGMALLADLSKAVKAAPEAEQEALRQELEDRVAADFRRALELGAGDPALTMARRYLKNLVTPQREMSVDFMNRGHHQCISGDPITGLELLGKAVDVDGTNAEARWLYANALQQASRLPEAASQLKAALSLDPELLPALALATRVLYLEGSKDQAKIYGERFLKLTEEIKDSEMLDRESERVRRILKLIEGQ